MFNGCFPILAHAAAVHGVVLPTEGIDLARIALGGLDLVGRSNKAGNNQQISLLSVSGYDPCALISEQRRIVGKTAI